MSYIIYLKKDENHTYAYHATSYRDPITRKPKSKRIYIGRVDTVTKEFLNPEDAKKLQAMLDNEKGINSLDAEQPYEGDSSDSFSGDWKKELNKVKEAVKSQQKEISNIQKEQKEIRKLFDMIERAIHLSATQE